MRITHVELYSNDEEVATFSLENNASKDQYWARAILGLDADEIYAKYYGNGTVEGFRFHEMLLGDREIVIRTALNPRSIIDETNSDLRDRLYRAISSNRGGLVTLRFYAGAVSIAYIQGHIKKIEVPHMSRTPEAQVTIQCEYPMFTATNQMDVITTGLAATNPVNVGDSVSTAPHGLHFEVIFTANELSFEIVDGVNGDWNFEIIPGVLGGLTGFRIGDHLHFSSVWNDQYITLVRGATTYHLLDKIVPGSIWPLIFPGSNLFTFSQLSSFDWDHLKFFPSYWGI